MTNTYRLVNPYIKGKMNTSIKSKNSHDAAKSLYNSLSEHFNNNVPEFHFTIQKGSSGKGKYYHFQVNEKREGDEISFSIKPYVLKNEKKIMDKFSSDLNKFKGQIETQSGGLKKKKRSKKKSKKRSKRKSHTDSEIDDLPDLDDPREDLDYHWLNTYMTYITEEDDIYYWRYNVIYNNNY